MKTVVTALLFGFSLNSPARLLPALSIAPNPLDFGTVTMGTTAQNSVSISNTSGGSVTITSASVTPGDFTIVTAVPMAIAPGTPGIFSLSFSPTAQGMAAATLTLGDDLGETYTIILTGTGATELPVCTFPGTILNFPDEPVGTSASSVMITIQNQGTGSCTITAITVIGPGTASFMLNVLPLPITLASSDSMSFFAVFDPTSTGLQTALVQLTTTASTYSVTSLSGSGTPPVPPSSPPSSGGVNGVLADAVFSGARCGLIGLEGISLLGALILGRRFRRGPTAQAGMD
jgi:hypothetical protein